MATLKGKHTGGSKVEMKDRITELENIVRKRDAEISRLMHRVTFVEMTNNKTEAECELLRDKHFVRTLILKLFKR